ncbi:MAG TPA: ribonuclease R, partial [Ruminococcaceae bacterium]|nr:ribonuclease R [Oscillospiraceae bacterium]
MKEIENQIIRCLEESGQSLPIRDLLKELRVRRSQKKAFFQALDGLEQDGKITVSKKGRVHLPEKSSAVEATIVSYSRGFAFARPDDGGDDLFIHSDKLKDAFIGDHVLLNNIRTGPKGQSAEVGKVAEKGNRLVTGTLKMEDGTLVLDTDIAVRYAIPVAKKGDVKAKEGDKVQAKVRRK